MDGDTEYESRNEGPIKPFLGHLEDLRSLLVRLAVTIAISFAICFNFAPDILRILTYPLIWSGVQDPQGKDFLSGIDPMINFSLPFTLSLYASFCLASPILFYFIASYIMPALTPREKRMVRPILLLGGFFFIVGVAFCYFFLLPSTFKVSKEFADWMHIRMDFWKVDTYISFVTIFLLGMGISFEFPLVILVLAKLGMVSYKFLARSRRYAIVIILILSAIITPSSDAITLMLMATPLIVMYEICIWSAWFMQRNKPSLGS